VIPERDNRTARHVGADLAHPADAEAGPEELRTVLRRFAWDDAIEHARRQALVTPGQDPTPLDVAAAAAYAV